MIEMSSGLGTTMGLGVSTHGSSNSGNEPNASTGCRLRAQSQASQGSPGHRQGPRGSNNSGQPSLGQSKEQKHALQTSQQARSKKDNCCLCWCCCCSCCTAGNKCLAAVGTGGSGGASSMRYGGGAGGAGQGAQGTHHGSGVRLGDDLDDNGAGLEGDINDISLEEIRSWGSSFDRLMRNPLGRKLFKEFLVSEYSDENIAFWLACEQLKKEENNDKIEEKARVIYEDYISIISPKEVSLDSRVREIVNRNMTHPTPHTFDEAQLQIYTLMHRDSYPRFVNSELYQKMARINSGPPSPSIEAAADGAALAVAPPTAALAASSSSSTTSTQPVRKSKKSIT
ncbi:regulator of G-protein signaling 17 isoform X1 [Trichogramma pretiosum]|uniref:regulator of G-protein signaling 17 isoform X1 n=1 Tax=Trichogramma pretiosum TaxID=7493 RepID=UPI000C719830|nr:regulator of G-protein signaling 17 isoform X1 [Trichogramma pretiosum]